MECVGKIHLKSVFLFKFILTAFNSNQIGTL
jgi:hypothetical protein